MSAKAPMEDRLSSNEHTPVVYTLFTLSDTYRQLENQICCVGDYGIGFGTQPNRDSSTINKQKKKE